MTEKGKEDSAMPPDEAALIEALRRGDEDAFARLVDQHHAALRRIARLYVSSPAIAEDVVQDTWLAVIRGLSAFEGRSSLKTWILRILINRSKTRAVREGRTIPFSDAGIEDPETLAAAALHEGFPGEGHDHAPGTGRDVPIPPAGTAHRIASLHDPGLSPEAKLLTEESRAQLRAVIDSLPPNQRVVITMRDLEGCSSEEVCNTLGLSETNQRVILHRARSSIRSRLTAGFRVETE